jgi:hypothetical protein
MLTRQSSGRLTAAADFFVSCNANLKEKNGDVSHIFWHNWKSEVAGNCPGFYLTISFRQLKVSKKTVS